MSIVVVDLATSGCPSLCVPKARLENHRSPGGIRTGEWQAIAGTLVPNFGLRTAASELDASLWLAERSGTGILHRSGSDAVPYRQRRKLAAGIQRRRQPHHLD